VYAETSEADKEDQMVNINQKEFESVLSEVGIADKDGLSDIEDADTDEEEEDDEGDVGEGDDGEGEGEEEEDDEETVEYVEAYLDEDDDLEEAAEGVEAEERPKARVQPKKVQAPPRKLNIEKRERQIQTETERGRETEGCIKRETEND
jgi:hypothetical protein